MASTLKLRPTRECTWEPEMIVRMSERSSLRYVLTTLTQNPQLRRVQAAFVTHNSGEYASWIAMLVYAYAQGGVTESGIVATVMLIPSALFAPVLASLGQRFALGTSLFAAYVAQAVTNGAVAVALFADASKLVVYALLVGPAVAFTMTRPTQSALTPALARSPEELTATNVVSGWIESVSIFVAPALAGVVLAIGSEATVFALVGVSCLVGAGFVAPLRGLGAPTHGEHEPDESVRGSLAFVRSDPPARLLLLLLSVQGIAIGALDVLAVELALSGLGRGEDWVGYLDAAFGLGGVLVVGVTAGLVGRGRLAPPLVVSLGVWSVAFLGLAVMPGAFGVLVLLVVAGGARATFDVAGRTLLQRVARPDLLARVFGLLEGGQMATLALGSLLAPVLVWLGGLPLAFVVVAATLPLFALAVGRTLLDIDRHATVPVVEVALLRRVPMLAPLPPPTLEALARALEPVSVPAGVDVIREGDLGDRYYVVADGEVEVERAGRTVAIRRRGDGFGEIALMYDVPRTATVRARTPAQLYALDRDTFLVAVTGHAPAQRAARDLAAERLRELEALDERASRS
ncbi:MAG TPA: MFS transporter [Gaiellaceae bacterium]|nr:MFS transporter [Gaiellaceae bacterium]